MTRIANVLENPGFQAHLFGGSNASVEAFQFPLPKSTNALDETKFVSSEYEHNTALNDELDKGWPRIINFALDETIHVIAEYKYDTEPSNKFAQVWIPAINEIRNLSNFFFNKIYSSPILRAVENTTRFTSIYESVIDADTTSQVVEGQLERLFAAARDEQFEVGIESQFSKGLQNLFRYDPTTIIQSLRNRLTSNDADPEVLAEVLRWASRQDVNSVRDLVVDLLSVGLHNASSLVRDAAALSLAHLEEAAAVELLKRALNREKVPELREDLEDLILSLEY